MPKSVDDLAGHKMVGFRSSTTGGLLPLEFTVGGTCADGDSPVHGFDERSGKLRRGGPAGAGAGAGVPRYHLEDDLAGGVLVRIVPDHPPAPTPVSVLYPHSRQLSPRVRVFIEWLA